MSKKLYPNTILQALSLPILFVILGSPSIFLKKIFFKDAPVEIVMLIGVGFSFLALIAFIHLVNIKKKITYNFSLKYIGLIPIPLIILLSFQLGIYTPLAKLIFSFTNPDIIPSNPINSITSILSALILAPIFEEIIFRGYILKGFLSTYSSKKAIIVSAIFFGLVHFYPYQIIGVIPLGLFFGWIYYKTGSIGITIILHSFTNLIGLFTGWVNLKYGSQTIGSINDIYGGYSIYIIIIAVASCVFFLRFFIKNMKSFQTKNIIEVVTA
jgi:membrane protease YdiL (CAAX protease family)